MDEEEAARDPKRYRTQPNSIVVVVSFVGACPLLAALLALRHHTPSVTMHVEDGVVQQQGLGGWVGVNNHNDTPRLIKYRVIMTMISTPSEDRINHVCMYVFMSPGGTVVYDGARY